MIKLPVCSLLVRVSTKRQGCEQQSTRNNKAHNQAVMTPRKAQRQRNQPEPTPLVEDESEVMTEAQVEHTQPPAIRTNTELNLTVLGRYIPNVRSIAYIAASAVLYAFNTTCAAWEKMAIEGTLFIASDHDLDIETGNEVFTIMVLNRRGLNNFMVDIGDLMDVEVTKDLLIVGMEGEEGEEDRKVRGIWIHEDQDGIRETISNKIKELWDNTKAVRESTQMGFASQQPQGATPGRRLSLSEMFGRPV